MEIRILNQADAAEYKRIRLESLKNAPEAFGSSHEEESAQSDEFFINRVKQSDCNLAVGAFENGRLMAIACFYRENRPKTYHKGFVVAVYVSEAYRDQGIGKKIVGYLVSALQEYKGISKLQLRVNSENEPAKRVYAACGFIKEGFEKDSIRINNTSCDEDMMVYYFDKRT